MVKYGKSRSQPPHCSEQDGLLNFAPNFHGSLVDISDILFQVIIPASWIFGLIIYSPGFPTTEFDKNMSTCILVWPEEWMGKAYSMLCFLVFGVLPIPLMVAVYSKVVYHLWFKRNENNELSLQQKVCTLLGEIGVFIKYPPWVLTDSGEWPKF